MRFPHDCVYWIPLRFWRFFSDFLMVEFFKFPISFHKLLLSRWSFTNSMILKNSVLFVLLNQKGIWAMNYLGKPVPLVKHSKNAVTKPNFSRTLGMLKSEEPAGPSFSWLHVRSNTVRISWPRVSSNPGSFRPQYISIYYYTTIVDHYNFFSDTHPYFQRC